MRAVLLTLVLAGLPALASNIVVNGNFGTGDFTGWTVSSTGDWAVEVAGDNGGNPYPGDTYFASTGCSGSGCIDMQQGSLSQVLTDVPGTSYTLTFEFSTNNNGTPNELDVLWNGTSVLDLGTNGTLGPINGYELFTVKGLVGTGSDTLTFLGRQDPGDDALDNVSLAVAGVPEPSTLLLLGSALGTLGLIRRRRV